MPVAVIDDFKIPLTGGASAGRYFTVICHPLLNSVTLTRGKCHISPVYAGVNKTWGWVNVATRVSTLGTGSSVRLGVFELDETNGFKPKTLLVDAGTIATTSTGEKIIAISLTTTNIKWLGVGVQAEGSATPPAITGPGASSAFSQWPAIFGYSTLTNPGAITDASWGLAYDSTVGDGAFPTDFVNWSPVNGTLGIGWIQRSTS